MNVSFWLKVNAIAYWTVGLIPLIAPSALGPSYSGGVTPQTELVLRNLGAGALFLGIVSWVAAGADASPLKLWFVRGNALYAALALVLALVGISSGVMTSMGYLNVAVAAIFLVALGYFGFMRSETS